MEIAGYIVLGIVAYAFVQLLSGETFLEVWMSLLLMLFLGVVVTISMVVYDLLIRGTVLDLVLSWFFVLAFLGGLLWGLIQVCLSEFREENNNPIT